MGDWSTVIGWVKGDREEIFFIFQTPNLEKNRKNFPTSAALGWALSEALLKAIRRSIDFCL